MFKIHKTSSRIAGGFAAGRTGFGFVLTCGGLLLFARAWANEPLHAIELLRDTWFAALVAGLIGAVVPWPRRVPLATSLALPWVGLSLVLPLSLHYLVDLEDYDFDGWANIAIHLMIAAHILFAVLVVFRCRALAAGRVPAWSSVLSIWAIYAMVVGVSAIPFIVPAVYVALTGLPFIPLFLVTNLIAAHERAQLAEAA